MANNKEFLATAPVGKLLFKLALPTVVAQMINMLYNIVDRIYIGHIPEVGAAALTGVGLFSPILMLITAFAMMMGSGGSPLAAISMGKQDNDHAERIMANCFTVLLVFSVILTGSMYFLAPTLLRFFGASNVTLPYAVSYGRIYTVAQREIELGEMRVDN